jgi:hypothetical protein
MGDSPIPDSQIAADGQCSFVRGFSHESDQVVEYLPRGFSRESDELVRYPHLAPVIQE